MFLHLNVYRINIQQLSYPGYIAHVEEGAPVELVFDTRVSEGSSRTRPYLCWKYQNKDWLSEVAQKAIDK